MLLTEIAPAWYLLYRGTLGTLSGLSSENVPKVYSFRAVDSTHLFRGAVWFKSASGLEISVRIDSGRGPWLDQSLEL